MIDGCQISKTSWNESKVVGQISQLYSTWSWVAWMTNPWTDLQEWYWLTGWVRLLARLVKIDQNWSASYGLGAFTRYCSQLHGHPPMSRSARVEKLQGSTRTARMMVDGQQRFYLVMSCLNDKPMNRLARMVLTETVGQISKNWSGLVSLIWFGGIYQILQPATWVSSHEQISKSCKASGIDQNCQNGGGWSTNMWKVNNWPNINHPVSRLARIAELRGLTRTAWKVMSGQQTHKR